MWERLFQAGAVPGCPWRPRRSWIFPFPCFCLCLPCLTRLQRQLRGIRVGTWSFPGILLDVTFCKPFLYPSRVPGSVWPWGRSQLAHPSAQGFLLVFLVNWLQQIPPRPRFPAQPPPSIRTRSIPCLQLSWSLWSRFSRAFPCRGWLGTFGSVTVSTNHGFIPRCRLQPQNPRLISK